MKALIHICLTVCGFLNLLLYPLSAEATILRSNDVIVFQFSSLPWTHVTSSVRPTPFVDLFYSGTAGDSFRAEFFEDNTLQTPFYSNVNIPSLPGTNQETMYTFNFPPAYQKWNDRQGVIRFTGLSGTIVFTDIVIQVWDGTNLYRQILPIPQPPAGTSAEISIAAAIEISWPSQFADSYQVQWSSSLNTNDWFNLGSPIQGTGGTNYYLISTQGAEKRFYRVITLTP